MVAIPHQPLRSLFSGGKGPVRPAGTARQKTRARDLDERGADSQPRLRFRGNWPHGPIAPAAIGTPPFCEIVSIPEALWMSGQKVGWLFGGLVPARISTDP